jgi:D-threo-aldose 1-dehydrogenase
MLFREIRGTGVQVSEVGFGGAGIGELFTRVSDSEAERTLDELWTGGVRFFDTAPLYGHGLSELRIGRHLRERPRSDVVVATKVGWILRPPDDPATWQGDGVWIGGLPFDRVLDFSYEGVLRSYEDSLQRLGLNSIDMLVIHDLDSAEHDGGTIAQQWARLRASGWRALEELRAARRIGAIGLGIKMIGEIPRFLEAFDLDFVIVVGRYTLLDQSAFPGTFALCERRGVDVVLAATFSSGILAQGAVPDARLNYRRARPQELEHVARLDALCRRHDVPLQAAAIQFPLAHPIVKSVLVGAIAPDEARTSVQAYEHPIPSEFWDGLRAEGWIPHEAPTP